MQKSVAPYRLLFYAFSMIDTANQNMIAVTLATPERVETIIAQMAERGFVLFDHEQVKDRIVLQFKRATL